MVTAKDLMKTNFVKVDLNNTVSELFGKLRLKKQTFAVVFDGKKYKGMTGRKWLLTSRIDAAKTKLKNLTKKASKRKTPFYVPKLKPSTDLTEICRLFATADTRALPVLEKNELIGVVTANDVMKAIKSAYKGVPVTEIASIHTVTINMKSTTADAIKTMNREKVDRLPVVDRFGKIAGIVTEFDVLKRFHRWPATSRRISSDRSHDNWGDLIGSADEKQNLLKQPVKNIMTPYPMVHCADAHSTVTEVLNMLVKDNVSSIVLVDNEKPAGILTVQDIMLDYSRE